MKKNNNFEFKRFKLKDKKIIQSFIDRFQPISCEYNFSNLYAWQYVSKLSWTIYKGRLLIYDDSDSKCSFMPLGEDFPPDELAHLSKKLNDIGLSPDFCLAESNYLNKYLKTKEYYSINKEPDHAEYVYDVKKLDKLAGTKLQKKRNLISQFKRLYPDFKIDTLHKKHIPKVIAFSQALISLYDKPSKTLIQEFNALKNTCEHFTELDVDGLIINSENKIIAFSIFSKLNSDTYDIQFEKANRGFKGAAQIINHETAKYLKDKCTYINREQDLGIQGLRKAKMSYEPLHLFIPYTLSRIS